MDHKFTLTIKAWLDTPSEQRDYSKGAVYFLQLSNNKIMYHNMILNPEKYREFMEYQIRKYMRFRLASLTHEEVEKMQAEVDRIVAAHFSFTEKSDTNPASPLPASVPSSSPSAVPSASAHSASSPATVPSASGEGDAPQSLPSTSSPSASHSATVPSASPEGHQSEFQKGKRADHDALPVEIQALYVENLSLLQQMRELHLQLRHLSTGDSPCPDSERYPFLKEMIQKDKQYHKNWQIYDTYVLDEASSSVDAEVALNEDARAKSKEAQRKINLQKGKYKKKPSPELKEQILAQYRLLLNPTEKLSAELIELGILE